MRKYPRPGQQPAVRRHPFKECGLKFRRLLARGPKYVAIAKTSSPAEGGGSILPPNPRYSWVLSEQCCSAAEVGGVSSSVWRPSLCGFTPPSVIDNGASSLPVSSMPLAGQSVSTETSDDPAIVQRDSTRSTILPDFCVWVRINLSPEKLKNALRIIHILRRALPPHGSFGARADEKPDRLPLQLVKACPALLLLPNILVFSGRRVKYSKRIFHKRSYAPQEPDGYRRSVARSPDTGIGASLCRLFLDSSLCWPNRA